MNATRKLHDLGQSLWLDNITRDWLDDGTLERYIDEQCVTGLTSNPTIFEQALKKSSAYDAAIRSRESRDAIRSRESRDAIRSRESRDAIRRGAGNDAEALFFDLALEDLTRAADLFRPVWQRTSGVDGYVSLEVSPLLAYDTASTIEEAKRLHDRAGRSNLYIKIPGTREGLPAIEEAIFAGVPINVTLLFSREQYLAAADAYMRGIERRIDAGLRADVASVASLFVSRWDVAVSSDVPSSLRNRLGLAVAKRAYAAYRALLRSARAQRLLNSGARPQRLLWASTGTKDPEASDLLYVEGLAAPFTVNTMPERTLEALADHGQIGGLLAEDGGDAEHVIDEFTAAGVDVDALAAKLQEQGAAAFSKSWNALMGVLESKSAVLRKAG